MIVLDSNVVSELMKGVPSPAVLAWLDAQRLDETWTTAVSVFEVRQGLAILPSGKRQRDLIAAFEQVVRDDLGGRVLEFGSQAASAAADIVAKRSRMGRPIEYRDAMIAGTVATRAGAIFATRNTKDFTDTGIALVDPWSATPP